MSNETTRPENSDDLFLRDDFEIIYPYKANFRIFSKEFDVKVWREDGKKVVLIRNKKKENEKNK